MTRVLPSISHAPSKTKLAWLVAAFTFICAFAFALALTALPQNAQAEDLDLTTGTMDPSAALDSGAVSEASSKGSRSGKSQTGRKAQPKPGPEADFVPYIIHPDGSVSTAIFPFFPNPTTDAFIESIGEHARAICQKEGLYASVMIAQAILESGSGSSGLSKPPYNNLFGIKGSYKGSSVVMMTSEDDGSGHEYDIAAGFRSYPSVKESLEDYADLLKYSMGDFYAPAWKANARTYVQACDYLQGRYATDTTYSGKLQGIIIAYDLVQYDHPKEWANSVAARKAKANSMLHAYTLGGRVMHPLQVTRENNDASNTPQAHAKSDSTAEAANAAEGQAAEHSDEPDWLKRIAAPLDNPGVPLVLVSLGGLAIWLTRNQLIALIAALKNVFL